MRLWRFALGAVCAGVVIVPLGSARPTAATGSTTPPLPAPQYKTVSTYLTIPMSDGVRLGATITFPSTDGRTQLAGQFPVVFSMTPYGRDGVCGCPLQTAYPSRGIVSAVVDVRGTGGSGGNLNGNFFSPREQRDGYELVEWFGTRGWSSGKVGMVGGSYLAITQYLAAELQPPHLTAIAPEEGLADIYRDAYTYDGIPDFFFDTQYNAVQGGPGAEGSDIGIGGDSGANNDTNASDELRGVLDTANAKESQAHSRPIALDYLERPNDTQWYHDRSPWYRVGNITVPVLIYDGWRDGAFTRGDLEMYQALAQRPGVETRIDMSACTHKGCGSVFDPTHSANGTDDISAIEFDFMSHYLLGTTEHPGAPVSFDLQPAGPYFTATQWPPLSTQFTRLYLHPHGTTGQPLTGALSTGLLSTAPPGQVGSSSYFTDPLAGVSMSLDSYGTIAISPYVPTDQRLEQEQGLTWRTAPSTVAQRIVGPIQLHLAASSTATDTDWVARLSDVAPNGSETVITEGALRASHRALDAQRTSTGAPYHTDMSPQLLVPNQVYGFDVAIIATAYQLAPGHTLQLRLTTDDLPTRLPAWIRYDAANPARSQIVPMPPAVNTVEERASDPSWLLVPLQPS